MSTEMASKERSEKFLSSLLLASWNERLIVDLSLEKCIKQRTDKMPMWLLILVPKFFSEVMFTNYRFRGMFALKSIEFYRGSLITEVLATF